MVNQGTDTEIKKELSSIYISQAPSKVTYTAGESFDPAGIVVMAKWSDGSETDVTQEVTYSCLLYTSYQIMVWIKNTKALMLLRGILVLAVFILLAAIFNMHTILFIAENLVTVMATAAVVVFQPELRRALEKLGERKFLVSVVPFEASKEKSHFSEQTRESIIDAAYAMGKVKTGALIVVEQAIRLTEYESTGIKMDCLVSSQVLINICLL